MAKPQFPMHHVHFYQSLKVCGMALLLSLTAASALYVFHNVPRKEKYANFYANYDPMVSFNRMREGGYLASCPPQEKSKK